MPRASREESLRWWRTGCEQAKKASLCYALGRWYWYQGKTADDRKLGVRYLDLGCVGEDQRSCDLLDTVKAGRL